jgi:transposase-like protein
MKLGCPNLNCPHYQKSSLIIKDGSYWRKNDSRTIQRLKCTHCGKRFSYSTHTLEYRQNKRRVNYRIFQDLCSGKSMRRISKDLRIHQLTVKRKLIYLAKKSDVKHFQLLASLRKTPLSHIQMDDLITIEHTKMKPLSVTLIVEAKTRFILGMDVSQIPAFGHLAKKSVKKYGYRKSHHLQSLDNMLSRLSAYIANNALIESDEHKFYPIVIKKYLPKSTHKTYKSERSAIVGQGELKKVKYDPLFWVNQSCAMLRANINRLIRKTWCTTKDPEMLLNHLKVYQLYHNTQII